jgi:hypothetical protein
MNLQIHETCVLIQKCDFGDFKIFMKNPLDLVLMARYKISIREILSLTYIRSPKLLWV